MASGVNYIKPTTDHWVKFSAMVAKEKVFERWFDLAFSISFWTFVRTTPVININASPVESKHCSMLIMMYLHALRIIFSRLLEDGKKGILSGKFLIKIGLVSVLVRT